jgi:hypothetical protein
LDQSSVAAHIRLVVRRVVVPSPHGGAAELAIEFHSAFGPRESAGIVMVDLNRIEKPEM